MAGYVKKVKFVVNFDGQQIDVELKPLTYDDLLLLRKDNEPAVVQEYQKMLPRYVAHLSPILDSLGQPVSIEEIAEAAYFAPLVGRVLSEHLAAAMAPQTPTLAGQSGD